MSHPEETFSCLPLEFRHLILFLHGLVIVVVALVLRDSYFPPLSPTDPKRHEGQGPPLLYPQLLMQSCVTIRDAVH